MGGDVATGSDLLYILPTSSSGSAPPEYMHDIELGAYFHAKRPPSPSPSSSSPGSTHSPSIRTRPFVADALSPTPRAARPSTWPSSPLFFSPPPPPTLRIPHAPAS
ncbi:hypothetical protein FB451DRAFT_1414892 [Mycena latifolia]|nr:hypothetical protein FB451DRAFT_1414892 [Mycena latifolia]